MRTKPSQGISDFTVVGRSARRVDVPLKVTGKAYYLDDLRLPGMLHGKALRSPHPHALIKAIDVSDAYRVPGVKAVVTGAEFPHRHGLLIQDEPFLADGRVRYIGEAVAAVAATTVEAAQRGVDAIRVVYEPLPAVFDVKDAMRPDAPRLHPEFKTYEADETFNPLPGTNVCSHYRLRKGNVEEAFRDADHVFEHAYSTGPVQHCALEPHAAIAMFDETGRITLWTPNDGPHRCLREVAGALKMPFSRIRVIAPFQGGGFGGKGSLRAEAVALALVSKIAGRPVKVTYSREEVFTSTLIRHPVLIRSKIGVMKDGRITAKEVELLWNTGAYGEKGPWVCRNASMSSPGPYDIPNVAVDGYCVYTNNPIAGPMRGFGIPQVTFACESQLDEVAHALGMDPLELRLQNALEKNDEAPWGERLVSIGLKECLKKAARGVGWSEPSRGESRGKAIACMHKFTTTLQGVTSAIVRYNYDGSVDVLTSTMEVGQGAMTVLGQFAAEDLGVPVERIRVSFADTDYTPFDASTTGSRSTYHMGNAVLLACRDIKRQALLLASELLGVPRRELAFKDGRIVSRNGQDVALTELLRRRGSAGDIVGRGTFHLKSSTGLDAQTGRGKRPAAFWMYGAQAVEVEVDRETGKVSILKLCTAHDVGRVINPQTCQQQMEGAVAMGVGYALMEKIELSKGRTLNPSFEGYRIPTSMDVPEDVQILFVENSHPEGPFGAKGLAEPACAPTAAAIANAIFTATGVRIRELPLTAERIEAALSSSTPDKVYAEGDNESV